MRCYFEFLVWGSEAEIILLQGALKRHVRCSSTQCVRKSCDSVHFTIQAVFMKYYIRKMIKLGL